MSARKRDYVKTNRPFSPSRLLPFPPSPLPPSLLPASLLPASLNLRVSQSPGHRRQTTHQLSSLISNREVIFAEALSIAEMLQYFVSESSIACATAAESTPWPRTV